MLKQPNPPSRPKITEVRCIHSYQADFLYKMRGYGFDFFMCKPCLNSLISLINHLILTVDKNDFKFNEMGIFCDRCEQWKVGTFYILHRKKLKREKIINSRGEEVESAVLESGPLALSKYCEECFRDMDRHRIIVTTKRNIYIPAEVDDKVVNALFEDRLQRTDQVLTLVPTRFLQKLMNIIPEEKKAEVIALITDTTPMLDNLTG